MRLSILTCVLGEPDALHQTHASIKPLLSTQLTWTLKFAPNASDAFRAQFEGPHVFCHCEPDNSVYQAMTQGLEAMDADYYCVLGAGDELIASGVQQVAASVAETPTIEALFAPIVWSGSGVVWSPAPSELPLRMACPHPGAVLRVDRSRALGGYDTRYQIAADYDHISRYVRAYGPGRTLSAPLVLFAGGGMSEVRAFEGTLEEELIRMRVWKSHEYAVYARLMQRTATVAASLFDQVARMYGKA